MGSVLSPRRTRNAACLYADHTDAWRLRHAVVCVSLTHPLTWMPATHAVTYVSLKHAEAYASQTRAVCTTCVSDACCKICVPDARCTACHTPALGSRQKPSVIITGLSLEAIAVSLVTMHPDVCMHARMCVNVHTLICICACILTRMSESGRACVSIFECRCACLHGYMDACHAQMV